MFLASNRASSCCRGLNWAREEPGVFTATTWSRPMTCSIIRSDHQRILQLDPALGRLRPGGRCGVGARPRAGPERPRCQLRFTQEEISRTERSLARFAGDQPGEEEGDSRDVHAARLARRLTGVSARGRRSETSAGREGDLRPGPRGVGAMVRPGRQEYFQSFTPSMDALRASSDVFFPVTGCL